MGRLIDADRLKEIFSRNVVGGNAYFDLIDIAPTVEAIPKDDYEARLKADMVAILKKLGSAIKSHWEFQTPESWNKVVHVNYIDIEVNKKINELKVNKE